MKYHRLKPSGSKVIGIINLSLWQMINSFSRIFSLEYNAELIKAGESKRGKPSIIDKNNYSNVGNEGVEGF